MNRPTYASARWPLILAGVLLLGRAGHAKFAAVDEPVPVERLVKNVSRYIQEHPDNARAHYTLGRIHSLAFVQDTPDVPVMRGNAGEKDLPGFAPYQSIQIRRVEKGPLSEAAKGHLRESLREYTEATRLMPKDALPWMGKGWMLEQGISYADTVSFPENFPKFFRKPDAGTWRDLALEAYRQAYKLAREEDLAQRSFGPAEDYSITMEAGEGILRLLVDPKTPELRLELIDVRDTVEKLKRIPHAVTPVIFSLDRDRTLASLLEPRSTVTFDLAGAGQAERWPWVRPDTCILAWDPAGAGQIRSGRQLFGSATWAMFWKDGYQPLEALDDDGDGLLTGPELNGLVVWRDANGNGRSDPGEVVPLTSLGVRSIAVRERRDSGGLTVTRGSLLLESGKWVPTYDWFPTSRPRAPK